MNARNAANKYNRTTFLWTVRNKWPAGARFTFNCYIHWVILIIRGEDREVQWLASKEGVTQGNSLSMVNDFTYDAATYYVQRAATTMVCRRCYSGG